jgi:hypothetical protein
LTLSAALGRVTALVLEETSQYSQQIDSGVLTAVIWREKQDVLIWTNVHHPPADMGCTNIEKGW